jgi:phosphoribosylaminoimidazole-succinocarboxamide synthase
MSCALLANPRVSTRMRPPQQQFVGMQGKVRDVYKVNGKVVMVTTDRLSAFDRNLAAIPFKVRLSVVVRKSLLACQMLSI